jgi:SAM-dependent methyltransferase
VHCFVSAAMHIHRDEWERAEIQRSWQEALHTSTRSLHADEKQMSRYLDPALDSVFPLEYAFALLGDIRGRLVLDLGCGSGANSLLLARRGARVVGVDISDALIQLARRRLEMDGVADQATFVVASAHNLPLAAESVDVIVGMAVLHHLQVELCSREVFRVLKTGGRAIFKEPVRPRMLTAMRSVLPCRSPDVSPFERPLTSSDLRAFASPFHTIADRAFCLPFVSVGQRLRRLRPHLAALYRVDGAVLRRLPSASRLASIRVVALSKEREVLERTLPPVL